MGNFQMHQSPADNVPSQSFPYQLFPGGLKVLLVGTDSIILTVSERELLRSNYHVFRCSSGALALKLLRENSGNYDLIMSSDFLEDMDGYEFIRYRRMETNVPHILISGDERATAIERALKYGVCDYLIPPVNETVMRNIWQHVWRRRRKKQQQDSYLFNSNDSNSNEQQIIERHYQDEATTSHVNSITTLKRGIKDEDEEDDELENYEDPPLKRRRVVWTPELHQKFVDAINLLGPDKTVPKAILEVMNDPSLTRENVASHLQKYRLFLKRLGTQRFHQYQHVNGITITEIPAGFAESSSSVRFDNMQTLAHHVSAQPLSVIPAEPWLLAHANPTPLLLDPSMISPPLPSFYEEDAAPWSTTHHHHHLPHQMQPESFRFGPIVSLATTVGPSSCTESTSNMQQQQQQYDQTLTSGPSYTNGDETLASGPSYTNGDQALASGPSYTNGDQTLASCPSYINGDQTLASGPSYTNGDQTLASCPSYTNGDQTLASGPSYINGDQTLASCPSYNNGDQTLASGPSYTNGDQTLASGPSYINGDQTLASCPSYNNGDQTLASGPSYTNGDQTLASGPSYINGDQTLASCPSYNNGDQTLASGPSYTNGGDDAHNPEKAIVRENHDQFGITPTQLETESAIHEFDQANTAENGENTDFIDDPELDLSKVFIF